MYELEVEYVGSNIKLNTGLYAIENYIKNNDYFSDNPSIYNPFHNKINIGFDKDYSYDKDQLSSKVNYKEYINKRVQILDTYWDKNTDEKIKEDIGDNDIIIKEVYNNYDGDYGTGVYVKIETIDDISLIIPIDDINFLEGTYKGGSSDESSDIISSDINLSELSFPSELSDVDYIYAAQETSNIRNIIEKKVNIGDFIDWIKW